MKIIAIDPGSIITGYAVVTETGRLLDAGLIKPKNRDDPPNIRIGEIVNAVHALLIEHEPDIIVLEWTTGKVNKGRHKGGGRGLAIYGIAVGAIWITMELWHKDNHGDIVLIDEGWTKGVKKKKRLEDLELTCSAYNREDDKSGDMGDAICLGEYYLKRLYAERVSYFGRVVDTSKLWKGLL